MDYIVKLQLQRLSNQISQLDLHWQIELMQYDLRLQESPADR